MSVWVLRWPNGDCSLVAAPNKATAYAIVDEVADPGGAQWIPVKAVAAHFHLTDNGTLEFEEFDGRFDEEVIDAKVYPLLIAAQQPDFRDPSPDEMREAVRAERDREIDTSQTQGMPDFYEQIYGRVGPAS